jgi:cell wall-associated NlpC family hydrolase
VSQDCQIHRPPQQALAVLMLALLASACTPFRPGAPYRYGGTDPARGFDCSGLVSYAHSREGISVPRTAAAQFAAARKVDPAALRTGDLVFFRLVPGSREVTHVGIYTGQRRFVHAPQTGRNVSEASLDDPYYRERFAGAGRLFPDGPGAGPHLKSSPR